MIITYLVLFVVDTPCICFVVSCIYVFLVLVLIILIL